MHGAQGAGCAPVATAFAAGGDDVIPVRPTGIAKSLAIGNPADGVFALGRRPPHGGQHRGRRRRRDRRRHPAAGPTTGIFTETAGGVTVAVLRKLAERGEIGAGRDGGRLHHRRRPEDDRRGGT